jgi:hypothetical protein
MAKYVVNSRLSFARNFILAEKSRLRSSPLLQAAIRYGAFKKQIPRKFGSQNTKGFSRFRFQFLIFPQLILWHFRKYYTLL